MQELRRVRSGIQSETVRDRNEEPFSSGPSYRMVPIFQGSKFSHFMDCVKILVHEMHNARLATGSHHLRKLDS